LYDNWKVIIENKGGELVLWIFFEELDDQKFSKTVFEICHERAFVLFNLL
jgi:hypothetical protein